MELRALVPFDPASPLAGARVLAAVDRAGTRLSFRYALTDIPTGVHVPAPAAAPARTDQLWERTCLEAFVAPVDAACYWEVNLSPAGDWNVYRFDGYRHGMTPDRRLHAPVAFASSSAIATGTGGTLTLAATLDFGPVPELLGVALDAGLAAVVATRDGVRCHYALRHAVPGPDFHARDTFVVRIDVERGPW